MPSMAMAFARSDECSACTGTPRDVVFKVQGCQKALGLCKMFSPTEASSILHSYYMHEGLLQLAWHSMFACMQCNFPTHQKASTLFLTQQYKLPGAQHAGQMKRAPNVVPGLEKTLIQHIQDMQHVHALRTHNYS